MIIRCVILSLQNRYRFSGYYIKKNYFVYFDGILKNLVFLGAVGRGLYSFFPFLCPQFHKANVLINVCL